MKTSNAVSAFAALAHASRLAIFRALVEAGPAGLSAGKIGEATGISAPSVSFHMKELRYADMVAQRQEGRFIIYTVNFAVMNALVAFLSENCCGGTPSMTASTPVCAPSGGNAGTRCE